MSHVGFWTLMFPTPWRMNGVPGSYGYISCIKKGYHVFLFLMSIFGYQGRHGCSQCSTEIIKLCDVLSPRNFFLTLDTSLKLCVKWTSCFEHLWITLSWCLNLTLIS
jgi:hypothetical protein